MTFRLDTSYLLFIANNTKSLRYKYEILQLSIKGTKHTLTAFCKIFYGVNATLSGHLQYLQHISPNTADICCIDFVSYSYYQ